MSTRSRNISYDSNPLQMQVLPSEERKFLMSGMSPNPSRKRLLSDTKYQFISQMSKHPMKERVAPSRYDNELIRYSENSFMRKKQFQFSSPKAEDQHNYSYIGQIVALEKKKGRMLYRKKDMQKQAMDIRGKNIMEVQTNKIKGQISQPTQSCQPTVEKEPQSEMNIEQMHYEMVKTQQKCKKLKIN